MELGQRIRQARLEAGLSQRQLCGDAITRNMLSQIENGSVQPSMGTLRFLALRLGKPVSYFLDENGITSPNVEIMAQARSAYTSADHTGALEILRNYRQPDGLFDWEMELLRAKSCMALADQAIAQGRLPYACELLQRAQQAGNATPYWDKALNREYLLLLAQASPEQETDLPEDDRELLLRAKWALDQRDPLRCAQYLDAAQNTGGAQWNYLRGDAYFMQKQYAQAAECYRLAEDSYPKETAPRLEQCYQAMEDYKMAYFYACKQRNGDGSE